jgi:hypothetical protein
MRETWERYSFPGDTVSTKLYKSDKDALKLQSLRILALSKNFVLSL